jgi:hypothetical protein
MIRTLMIATAFGLCACGPPMVREPAQAPAAQPPVQAAAPEQDQDLFVLMIDVGRTGVFLDRAASAAGFDAPVVLIPEQPGIDPQSELGIWRNLRNYGRDAVFYKEIYCGRGFVKGAACAAKPPAFISAEDSPAPDKVALQKNLEELQVYFGPILDAACVRGKQQTNDPMFCSVE